MIPVDIPERVLSVTVVTNAPPAVPEGGLLLSGLTVKSTTCFAVLRGRRVSLGGDVEFSSSESDVSSLSISSSVSNTSEEEDY